VVFTKKAAPFAGSEWHDGGTGKRSGLWKQQEVLTVFVFDERESKQVEDWRAALERLADDELFWFALRGRPRRR
jgi:hypothetical protein